MANKWGKDKKFKLDNAAGSLTEITSYCNQSDLQGIKNTLDELTFGNTEEQFQEGINGATIPLGGFVNTTTDAIFGPLIGNYGGSTKTWAFYNGVSWYTGESIPSDPQYGGDPRSLQTWSTTLVVDNGVTRTSVEPT